MRPEDSDLYISLHRSAAQEDAWQGFLAALLARAGAGQAALVVQTGDAAAQAFLTPQSQLGAIAPHLSRMRYLRVYGPDDFQGLPPFRAIRIKLDGAGDAWLMVARGTGDFAATTSVLLGGIAPHLAVAVAAHQTRIAAQMRAQISAETCDRLGLFWCLLGADGGIISHSGNPPELSQLGARPRLPSAIHRRVLAHMATSQQPMALTEQGLQWLLHLAPQGWILYAQTPQTPPHFAPQLLADLLALPLAEARFAQQLAAGDSIIDAGAALNLTAQTARFYSKQVYAKLGVPRQSEVVRLVQNCVLRLLK